MKKKKIIEMCGFLGSGKSYVLANINYQNGVIVNTEKMYEYIKDINIIYRHIINIKFLILNLYFVIISLFYSIVYGGKYGFKRGIRFLRYISIYEYVIKNKISEDIIVLDQGLVQFIWSITSQHKQKPIQESSILQLMIKYIRKRFDISVVYYNIDTELAAERASMRKSECPIDSWLHEDIVKLYRLHNDDFNILIKYFNKEKVYVTDSQAVIEEILNKIED